VSEAPSYFHRLQPGGYGPGAVHTTGDAVVTPSQGKAPGGEATLKVCGVGVAMLPGYSWAAALSTGWW
jgi:hypothetical protein